jgi:UDP-glucose 4-epimerase
MKVLIVGGAGFVGVNLARCCVIDESSVTVVDSLDPRLGSTVDAVKALGERVRFVHGDMRDAGVMAELVRGHDVIVNCAGQTSHPLSMEDPQLDVALNCAGTLALLETVRQHNRDAVVIYTSSSTVTGKAVSLPIDETHREAPLDIYSANKLAAEKYHRIYHTAHGLKTIILRFANLYGPFGKGMPAFGFVNYFIHLAATDQEIRIFGPGEQLRNMLYVGDACELILRAARITTYGEPLFAVHDEHLSVRAIAQQIIAAFGRGKQTHVEWPEDRKRIEVDDVRISGARLCELTDWAPRYSFREGLAETRAIMEGTR